jgi:hypothetical protein
VVVAGQASSSSSEACVEVHGDLPALVVIADVGEPGKGGDQRHGGQEQQEANESAKCLLRLGEAMLHLLRLAAVHSPSNV